MKMATHTIGSIVATIVLEKHEEEEEEDHDHFCPHCNLRPCVLEERAEEIYYIFAGVRLEVTSRRRKRFKAYKEFVRMIYGTLGVGVRVELPSCCVETIRGEFPKESDGEAYTGFQLANNN